jgi:hypothetical protein
MRLRVRHAQKDNPIEWKEQQAFKPSAADTECGVSPWGPSSAALKMRAQQNAALLPESGDFPITLHFG